MKIKSLSLYFLSLSLSACSIDFSLTSSLSDSSTRDTTLTNVTKSKDDKGRKAELISAFYGLDDSLPRGASLLICKGAAGKDGMPVIFSHEIDIESLQAGDFKITTHSGKNGELTCVTPAPANDQGELRTVLLVGDFGNIDDQPVKVEVTGNILSIDKSMNFKGSSIAVTPLEVGPTLVLAEPVPESQWELGKTATRTHFGGGDGCPTGTQNVVRVTWDGGVSKPTGGEINDIERRQYKVTLQQEDGSSVEITPFAIGDKGDGDNNHELCLDATGIPTSVFFPAGYVVDPRKDLNPDTTINVRRD